MRILFLAWLFHVTLLVISIICPTHCTASHHSTLQH